MKRCPRCGGTRFYTTAHIMQEWEVDGEGNFIEVATDCLEVTHKPCDDNYWVCANLECGYEGSGYHFMVEEGSK